MNYPFERLFLVCTGARCNDDKRGKECGLSIRDLLKDENKAAGRKSKVRVTSVSCLDLCDHGPNLLVWPEGRVYAHLTRDLAVEAYQGEMGDAPRRSDLELAEAEFLRGDSKAAKR